MESDSTSAAAATATTRSATGVDNKNNLQYADAQGPEPYWLPRWLPAAIIALVSLAFIVLLILLYNLFFQEGVDYQAKLWLANPPPAYSINSYTG